MSSSRTGSVRCDRRKCSPVFCAVPGCIKSMSATVIMSPKKIVMVQRKTHSSGNEAHSSHNEAHNTLNEAHARPQLSVHIADHTQNGLLVTRRMQEKPRLMRKCIITADDKHCESFCNVIWEYNMTVVYSPVADSQPRHKLQRTNDGNGLF